jgi:hypothetical protein
VRFGRTAKNSLNLQPTDTKEFICAPLGRLCNRLNIIGYLGPYMNTNTAPQGALKIRDAAVYLGGVSTITVRRLIKRGLIMPNRALRHLLIPISELDRFITGGNRNE